MYRTLKIQSKQFVDDSPPPPPPPLPPPSSRGTPSSDPFLLVLLFLVVISDRRKILFTNKTPPLYLFDVCFLLRKRLSSTSWKETKERLNFLLRHPVATEKRSVLFFLFSLLLVLQEIVLLAVFPGVSRLLHIHLVLFSKKREVSGSLFSRRPSRLSLRAPLHLRLSFHSGARLSSIETNAVHNDFARSKPSLFFNIRSW